MTKRVRMAAAALGAAGLLGVAAPAQGHVHVNLHQCGTSFVYVLNGELHVHLNCPKTF